MDDTDKMFLDSLMEEVAENWSKSWEEFNRLFLKDGKFDSALCAGYQHAHSDLLFFLIVRNHGMDCEFQAIEARYLESQFGKLNAQIQALKQQMALYENHTPEKGED